VADVLRRSQWHTRRATALGLLDRFEPPGSHRFRRYLTGLWWRARFGSAPWPPLKFKVKRFPGAEGLTVVPLPVLQRDAAVEAALELLLSMAKEEACHQPTTFEPPD
jgi:hypothetical protein